MTISLHFTPRIIIFHHRLDYRGFPELWKCPEVPLEETRNIRTVLCFDSYGNAKGELYVIVPVTHPALWN